METVATDPGVRAWALLVNTAWAMTTRLEDDLGRLHGLTLPAYDVLLALDEAPGGRLRQQALLSLARLTKSGVSRLIDRMEEADLVRTEICPSDRRGAYAVITESGHAVLDAARATHAATVADLFARHLSRAEARDLGDLLERVRHALPAHGATCQAATALSEGSAGTTAARQ